MVCLLDSFSTVTDTLPLAEAMDDADATEHRLLPGTSNRDFFGCKALKKKVYLKVVVS